MTLLRRLWFFLTRWRRMRELDEEMRLHLQMRAEANRRRGLESDEAIRAARLRFGNLLKFREEGRDMWGFTAIEQAAGDVRYAVRQFAQRPAWTAVVVGTLSLGIAANTSMFSLIDATLLKPPSWNRDDRLVWLTSLDPRSGRLGNMSYADYEAYRDRMTTVSGICASGGTAVSVGGGARPQRARGALVSGNYFDVLGVRATLGRTFAPDEDAAPGAHPVVVLSDAFWKEQFAADPTVVNRTVAINGKPFTIVGVAPPGFTGVAYADDAEQLWLPMAMQRAAMPRAAGLLETDFAWLHVVGRLRDGATISGAESEARLIAHQLKRGTPPNEEKSARVLAVHGGMTPWEQHDFGPVFGLVAIVPGFVLLVACANVANVLMARYLARRREFAMRRAIGASRSRVIRQLLIESLVLALLSAAAGFAVSFGLSAVIERYGEVPADVSALVTPDGRALFAAIAVAMATVIVFGLAPALMATRFDVLPVLKDEGTTSTVARGPARLRRGFVIAQVALSLTLLIVAGLFVQSLLRAIRVNPGFEAGGLAMVSVDTSLQGYPAPRRAAFLSRLIQRASALPGVVSVAAADVVPLGGEVHGATLVAEHAATSAQAASAGVSAGYFHTLELPLVRGREFTEADVAAGLPVAIVDESVAERLWPGGDPIGKQVRRRADERWREVVGVVHGAMRVFLNEAARGAYYVPLGPEGPVTVVIRTVGDPRAALSSLAAVARDLDPDLPLFDVQTMDERLRRNVGIQRAVASLLGVLGAVTLLLAAIGLYGVAAHSVSVRIREMGVRMSLGAGASEILRMVVRENVVLSLIGVAAGLVISTAGSKLLASFLFGLSRADIAIFAGASAVLCCVTVAATYLPARRAARVDPAIALRHD